ncbi:pirin family protein [Idiomarina sp. ST10R2A5]|uniref:pirin family protein n=1 Tax=Idiomarina sp. ST10R2A5 TaxID=3418368 RepID=UPI003EC867B6
MSNLAKSLESECQIVSGCGALKRIISPKSRDLGGFSVKRILPSKEVKSVGPWVFFDHMGPATFDAGDGINVRPHPHIGLATVTYLFEGEIQHKDSLGTDATVLPGDINLMVAGHGIVHSERQTREMTQQAHKVHGLQLWLALPKAYEDCEPSFHHYDRDILPTVDLHGGRAKVLIGNAFGCSSPVKTFSETLYAEVNLNEGESIQLPHIEELALYILSGNLKIGSFNMADHHMAVFNEEQGITVTAQSNTRLALIGGGALGSRFIEWNFVATDKQLIENAKKRWQQQEFPKVPGDSEDYIPLP